MDGPVHFPGADREAQWFGDAFPGVTMPRIDKLLLHTTEGSGWPGYNGGASAPTLTYHPTKHKWRQHFAISQSARALADPKVTQVRENRANVVQVEIICSCDPVQIKKHNLLDVRDLDDEALLDLGEFAAWLHREWGLPLVLTPPRSKASSGISTRPPERARTTRATRSATRERSTYDASWRSRRTPGPPCVALPRHQGRRKRT